MRVTRLLWEQLALPRIAGRARSKVLLSPHYTFPLLSALRRVVVVHDLTFYSMPQVHSRLKRVFFRMWIRLLASSSAQVVVPSHATSAELIYYSGMGPKRIVVAHLGIDSAVFSPPTAPDIEQFRASLDSPPSEWIAFLGTLEPRKNVPALIRAYARSVDGRESPPALLLAGGAGWDADVAPAIADARARGFDVRWLGYLPLDYLSPFLGGATVVAYPSLGEGFGLPVLEAMACGACVLTTRVLSIPEIGGDAVAYSGTDEASIYSSLLSLLKEPSRRHAFGSAALERSRSFTWSLTAASIAGTIRGTTERTP
jgi:glycosyltransferase involved in cell wall biosynthesis